MRGFDAQLAGHNTRGYDVLSGQQELLCRHSERSEESQYLT